MARRELFLALLCLLGSAGLSTAGGSTKLGAYELRKGDFSVKITNWGARLMSVVLPDSKGNLADVVLGRDTVEEYLNDTSYFGPITGRVAQRISRGRFVLDGKVYQLYRNDGNNTIHGGLRGFSGVAWTVKEYVGSGDCPYITLYYHSPDGEEGFPGAVDAYVTYRLSSPYTLSVRMNATALNRATPVGTLLHAYWNLGGHGSGDVLGHAPAVRVAAHRAGRGAPPVVGPRGARGRHAARLPDADAHRGAHPRCYGRARRRVRRQLRRRRRGHAAGGGGKGRRLRQGAGAVGQPADDAAVHGELAQPHPGEGRQSLRAVRRVLPRDHGLRGRGEPPRVPVADAQAGLGLQPRYGLQVLVLIIERSIHKVLHK